MLDEKREFLRYDFDEPIRYKALTPTSGKMSFQDLMSAASKNLSISGILFSTNTQQAPNISSLLVLDVNRRTANICHEIEDKAFIIDDKIFGKVVRIEDNENGTCNVGVAFLKKTDPSINNIKETIMN